MEKRLETMADVRIWMRNFSIFVYTGNESEDALLFELELEDLHEQRFVDDEDYLRIRLILKRTMKV